MRSVVVIPAFQAANTIGPLVEELVAIWPQREAIYVVDDGSTDGTHAHARAAGGRVIRHATNRGKGAALRTGLTAAHREGYEVGVTVDSDGQHPPSEALRLHQHCGDPQALVIGVRSLRAAGAPRANQLSNQFSNLVLSGFAGRKFWDTQCGLRRYPLGPTLALGAQEQGFGFEAEVLLLAAAAGWPIVETPVRVLYPPAGERVSHFHPVRDPARIVLRVLRTVVAIRMGSHRPGTARSPTSPP